MLSHRAVVLPILALLLLAFSPLLGSARELYVSAVSGDDANAGTQSEPFLTLQRCVDEWDDVEQVACNGAGVFNEELLITDGGPNAAERSRLIAWDTDGDGDRADESFILDGEGTRNIGIEVANGTHYVEVAWLTIRNYEPDGGCGDDGQLHHIRFGCYGGCRDWWIHDNRFEDLGVDCNGMGSYISIHPRGVPDLLLEHNVFDNIGGFIMRYFAGNGITIRDNTFNIDTFGIKPWDVQPGLDGPGIEDLTFENNLFVCDGNGTNAPGDSTCRSQAPIALADDCRNVTIRDNRFIDCPTAIHIATNKSFGQVPQEHIMIEGNESTITSNVCNPWSGSMISLDDCSDISSVNGAQLFVRDMTIRNNVAHRISGGIRQNAIRLASGHPFAFANDIVIENNTFRGYHEGIRVEGCGSFPFQLNGVTLRNNVFAEIVERHYSIWSGAAPTNWISDDNSFDPDGIFNWNATWSLDDWQSSTGEDGSSNSCETAFTGATGPALDPADTCALDSGVANPAVIQDFEGQTRPYGASWDRGADESWPVFPVDLRIDRAGGVPRLILQNPPPELPAIRYYRGDLDQIAADYSHASPFSGEPADPECAASPGATITDPDGPGNAYYLAVALIGSFEGDFGVGAGGDERTRPEDSHLDAVTLSCP